MIVIVKPHEIFLKKEEEINEKEVNISKCIFEFDEEITDEFVKEAIFVKDSKSIVKIIDNNECDYPPEILDSVGVCLIGVVATLTHDDEIIKRFNPSPQKFSITDGILREADNSQPITASELEQYKQALQNGLNEVKTELEKVIKTGNAVTAAGVYAEEQGNYAKGQAENIINSNDAAINIIKGFEENVDQHTTDFNENANSQTKTYNDNAKEKLETYNSNAETKTTDFNKNVSDKTTAFNTNAETKTTEYNTNADTKLQAYNDNASAKVKEYNDNATSKVEEYNQNADDKTEEFNKNADSYETRITENEKDIVDIESYLDNLTPKNTAKGELVHITDALGLPTFENVIDGNVKQETTKGYNILNLKDVSNTQRGVLLNIKNNKISTSGTANATGYVSFQLEDNVNLVAGDNIILHCDKPITLVLLDSGYQSLGIKWNSENSKKISFTEEKEIVYIAISVNEGTSYNYDDIKIMIERGTEVHEIEPFTNGASPNPEFPQEVEVLEGYNLFNSFIATKSQYQTSGELQIEKDGSFVVSGNTGSNNYFALTQTLGELCPSLKVGDNVYLYLETTSAVKNIYIGENWIHNQQKTITQALLDKIVIIYGGYNQTDKIKIQVLKELNKPYLPYACVGYKIHGKNLLPISKKASGESQGVIFTNNFDGTYTLKGTATANVAFSIYNDKTIKLLKNNSYTLSVEIIKGTLNFSIPISVKDKDNNLTYNFMTLSKPTVKCDKDYYIHQVDLYIPANTIVDCTICVQIELGDKATEYEPYKEQIVPLDLKGNWVGKIKDTDIEDYLVTDKKKLWLVKNVKKYVVTENEEITLERINDYGIANFFVKMPDLAGNFVCNHFIKQDTLIAETKTEGMLRTINGPYIRIKSSIASTVDEFKQWLSENNVEVYYPLATPEIIELGELPEPIKTFEGTNNIQVLANLDTEIEVKYALDIKKYYDNKLAEISAQII